MTIFIAEIKNLPQGTTDNLIRKLLSSKCKVVSLQMSKSSCVVQLESDALFSKLQRSPSRTMNLKSFLSIDSSGIGELKASVISLVG